MKNKKWAVICAIALAGCLVSGGYILHYHQNQKHAEELYEEARENAEQPVETITPTPVEATETPVPTPTEVPVDIP